MIIKDAQSYKLYKNYFCLNFLINSSQIDGKEQNIIWARPPQMLKNTLQIINEKLLLSSLKIICLKKVNLAKGF